LDGVRFVFLVGVGSGCFDSHLTSRSIVQISIPLLLPNSSPSFSLVDEAMVCSTTRRERVLLLFLAVLSSLILMSDAAGAERSRTRERDARCALAENRDNGRNLAHFNSRRVDTLPAESSMFVKSLDDDGDHSLDSFCCCWISSVISFTNTLALVALPDKASSIKQILCSVLYVTSFVFVILFSAIVVSLLLVSTAVFDV